MSRGDARNASRFGRIVAQCSAQRLYVSNDHMGNFFECVHLAREMR